MADRYMLVFRPRYPELRFAMPVQLDRAMLEGKDAVERLAAGEELELVDITEAQVQEALELWWKAGGEGCE